MDIGKTETNLAKRVPVYPLEARVNAFVEGLDKLPEIKPSAVDAGLYLDLSGKIVRPALGWQNGAGQIIDPFEGSSTPMTTARCLCSSISLPQEKHPTVAGAAKITTTRPA